MKKSLSLLLVVLCMISCTTIVDDLDPDRFPDLKSKIVIASFISPQDENIIVRVTRSVPIFDSIAVSLIKSFDEETNSERLIQDKIQYIENAEVFIKTEGRETKLFFNPDKKYYYYPAQFFGFSPGKKVEIRVNAIGQTATAETVIPNKLPEIENLKVESFTETNSFFGQTDTTSGYKVKMEWKDEPKVKNFYKVWGELESYVEKPSFDKNGKFEKYIVGKSYGYLFLASSGNEGANRYISDELFDGNTYKMLNGEVRRSLGSFCSSNICQKSKLAKNARETLLVQLSNISKEMYDYQISLQKFNRTSENPFAEPVPVYSNIKNGLGIFAGYQKIEVKKTFQIE